MAVVRTQKQKHLNDLTPGAKESRLGDCLYDLINAYNDLRAQYVALLAKLDAAAVAGGTNTATVAPTLMPVRLPEARGGKL